MTNDTSMGTENVRSISSSTSPDVDPITLRMAISFLHWRMKKNDSPTGWL